MMLYPENESLLALAMYYKTVHFQNGSYIKPRINPQRQIETQEGVLAVVEFVESDNVIAEVKFLYKNKEWVLV